MADHVARKRHQSGEVLLGIILVALNLIAFNYLSASRSARWDLTETRMYSLNPDTVRILQQMDDLITVKYFLTRDLPPGYKEILDQNGDLLEEFKVAAGGNLQVVYLDPTDDPVLATEAEQYGIPKVNCPALGSDSFEQKLAYIGLAVLYEDRIETIPDARYPQILEYELLMSIVRIREEERPTIAFNQGGAGASPDLPPELRAQLERQNPSKDRHDIQQDYALVANYLKKRFNVETVSLEERVPDYIETLVVANWDHLSDVATYHLDQFLMGGGRLALLVPGVKLDFGRMHAVPRDDRLDDWLGYYGITVDKNIVMDRQCFVVPFQSGRGAVQTSVIRPFPPVLNITREEINQESPVTGRIRDLCFPFSSSISLNPPDPVRAEILVRSSESAWAVEDNLIIHPDRIRPPPEGTGRRFDLAGILEGEFISYYAVHEVPEEVLPEPPGGEEALQPELPGKEGMKPVEGAPQGDGGKMEPDRKEADEPGGAAHWPQDGKEAPQESGADPGDEGGEPAREGRAEKRGEEDARPPGPSRRGEKPKDMKYQSPKTSILVLGSSELIGNCYCPLKQSVYHYTIRFFANAMDYLTAEEGFSDIRNRRVTARYIDPAFCEKPYKDILKITGTLGGALMVIVLGLYLGFKRRADQKREVVL